MAELDFRRLLADHHPMVFRIAYRVVGSREDAEDLTQETFMRLLKESEPSQIRDAKSWLARVAFNTSVSWRRSSERRQRREQLAATGDFKWIGTTLRRRGNFASSRKKS